MIRDHSTAAPHNDDSQGQQVQCMYSQAHPSQQCDVIIESHDLEWAQVLRQTLGVCPPRSPTFRHILEEYSRTYLCPRHRDEIDVHYNEYWQERLDQWTEDLRRCLQTESILRPRLQTSFNASRTSVAAVAESAAWTHRPATSAPASPLRSQRPSTSDPDSHRRNKSDPDPKERHPFNLDEFSSPSMPCFSMYQSPTGAASTFENVVTSPLTVAESKPGYMYAYRRITGDAQDQRHIRIGYSTYKIDDRVQLWSHKCQYFLELVCPAIRVRNAAKIEVLIHKELELSMKRRVDVRCKMDPKRCQTTHDDWFEIEASEAESVIQYWASWMESYDPYDNNGKLRPELLKSISEVRHVQAGALTSAHHPNGFNLDSRGRLWHNVRLANSSETPTHLTSTPALKKSRSASSKKASRRNKPVIPQRKSSLNLGPSFYSPSVPHLPLHHDPARDPPTPSPKLPRRKTSANLRSKYEDQNVVPVPQRPAVRSKSLASFRTEITPASHGRFASMDSSIRSSSSPPASKSLRRRNRNSSLRNLVSMQNLSSTVSSSGSEIMEATVARREKGRSIYIGAPTLKKISVLRDLSRIQLERS